jgi:apolipoprotein N-acyltransferase
MRERAPRPVFWWALCVLAGLAQATALAWPWGPLDHLGLRTGQPVGWLQVLGLATLVLALRRAPTARAAFGRAWLGATAWLCGTFWWLFISMHTYGGLAAPLAMLAVLVLAAALALYYALAGGLWWGWRYSGALAQALAFAALWTLAELARGVLFTGFPWGAGGYAHVDTLAALAPWVGVYGMGALAAALAVLLAGGRWRWLLAIAMLAWWLAPQLPRDWGTPAGRLQVRLLQGNIAQDEKFAGDSGVPEALAWYGDEIRRAQAEPTPRLVVAPETALPVLPQQLPASYWRELWAPGAAGPSAALVGVPLGSFDAGYTNSVWGWTPETASRALAPLEATPQEGGVSPEVQKTLYRYDKHHLVPFGEFIPPLFRWFVDLMNIPLGDFNRGSLAQPTLDWAGQRLAPNICYEDLFGEELAAGFTDAARAPTVLVNLSNIAWFGDSIAIAQHLQISRLRALELARPMLRATNTGATAVIDHQGRVTHQLPRLTRGALDAEVAGRDGLTPFARWAARWGLWPVLCIALALPLLLWRRRGQGPRHGR